MHAHFEQLSGLSHAPYGCGVLLSLLAHTGESTPNVLTCNGVGLTSRYACGVCQQQAALLFCHMPACRDAVHLSAFTAYTQL